MPRFRKRDDMAAVSGGVAFTEPGAGFPLSNSAWVIRPCFTARLDMVASHRS
jgi:hypothetical protein